MTFVWPVLICDQSAWVAAHVAAFSFFGAAPRQIRVDNLKTGGCSGPTSTTRW
jgi:transposase